MSTYRDLSELSGYTARVSELLDTMEDVKAGRYQKKLVGGGSTAGRTVGKDDEVAENAKSEPGNHRDKVSSEGHTCSYSHSLKPQCCKAEAKSSSRTTRSSLTASRL